MEKKPIKMSSITKTKLSGIGGWLILFIADLILLPFNSVFRIVQAAELKDPLGSTPVLDIPIMYFTVTQIGYSVLFVAALVLIVLFFRKSKAFVPLAISERLFRITTVVLLTLAAFPVERMRSSLLVNCFISVGLSVGCIMYYKRSNRVKNTFVK
ncbi:DUF2569 domain-containing protein [Acidaminobacter sp. JC074]|uniref:DUF2569 family protein n=1 Tax=Acidaminobacter sp. JC074 TaxID=2530199 RepID=UPI001F104451|nr:DUF2569 family protein [Acidaminobacter sp. JC074]MCH4889637.1 DUF2569 domain-containing protein [Acidaminobacter sp. JC074]